MPVPIWKLSLLPASFRGVPFHVDVATRSSGRRTVLHEFPKRNVPYAEDMGRKARAFPVTGYVIGPDYQLNRDALIYALEREGPGQLILPTMGELTAEMVVQPLTYGVRERRTAGGMAEFEMSFVEAGEAGFDSLVDTQGQSDMASDNAERTATDTSNKDLAEGSGGGGSTTPVLT